MERERSRSTQRRTVSTLHFYEDKGPLHDERSATAVAAAASAVIQGGAFP